MVSQKIRFSLTFIITLLFTLLTFSWQQILIPQFSGNAVIAQTKPAPQNNQKAQVLTLYQPLQRLQWSGQGVSNTGIAYFSVDGLLNESIVESDLDAARAMKDTRKIVKVLAGLGLSRHMQGEYDKAIDYYKQGLEIAKQNGYLEFEAMFLGDLGLAHVQKGDYYAEAVNYLNDYWTLIHNRNKKNNAGFLEEARALGNLGNAYYGADMYVKAIELHQQRLGLSRQIKDQTGEAKALNDLGIVYQALGNSKKAIEHYSQALTLAQQSKNKLQESISLGNLGVIYQNQGDYAKAIDYQQKRLAIARELKDLRSQAESLANLGGAAYFQGDYSKALAFYDEGWKITWERLRDADK